MDGDIVLNRRMDNELLVRIQELTQKASVAQRHKELNEHQTMLYKRFDRWGIRLLMSRYGGRPNVLDWAKKPEQRKKACFPTVFEDPEKQTEAQASKTMKIVLKAVKDINWQGAKEDPSNEQIKDHNIEILDLMDKTLCQDIHNDYIPRHLQVLDQQSHDLAGNSGGGLDQKDPLLAITHGLENQAGNAVANGFPNQSVGFKRKLPFALSNGNNMNHPMVFGAAATTKSSPMSGVKKLEAHMAERIKHLRETRDIQKDAQKGCRSGRHYGLSKYERQLWIAFEEWGVELRKPVGWKKRDAIEDTPITQWPTYVYPCSEPHGEPVNNGDVVLGDSLSPPHKDVILYTLKKLHWTTYAQLRREEDPSSKNEGVMISSTNEDIITNEKLTSLIKPVFPSQRLEQIYSLDCLLLADMKKALTDLTNYLYRGDSEVSITNWGLDLDRYKAEVMPVQRQRMPDPLGPEFVDPKRVEEFFNATISMRGVANNSAKRRKVVADSDQNTKEVVRYQKLLDLEPQFPSIRLSSKSIDEPLGLDAYLQEESDRSFMEWEPQNTRLDGDDFEAIRPFIEGHLEAEREKANAQGKRGKDVRNQEDVARSSKDIPLEKRFPERTGISPETRFPILSEKETGKKVLKNDDFEDGDGDGEIEGLNNLNESPPAMNLSGNMNHSVNHSENDSRDKSKNDSQNSLNGSVNSGNSNGNSIGALNSGNSIGCANYHITNHIVHNYTVGVVLSESQRSQVRDDSDYKTPIEIMDDDGTQKSVKLGQTPPHIAWSR